ncbi:uncharacterized protein [Physcomitrium patens]|uniref:uncharacterized protein n=1 Tax=Physcomitrium patens TaxID=3218 RepID=UPI003CCDCC75
MTGCCEENPPKLKGEKVQANLRSLQLVVPSSLWLLPNSRCVLGLALPCTTALLEMASWVVEYLTTGNFIVSLNECMSTDFVIHVEFCEHTNRFTRHNLIPGRRYPYPDTIQLPVVIPEADAADGYRGTVRGQHGQQGKFWAGRGAGRSSRAATILEGTPHVFRNMWSFVSGYCCFFNPRRPPFLSIFLPLALVAGPHPAAVVSPFRTQAFLCSCAFPEPLGERIGVESSTCRGLGI